MSYIRFCFYLCVLLPGWSNLTCFFSDWQDEFPSESDVETSPRDAIETPKAATPQKESDSIHEEPRAMAGSEGYVDVVFYVADGQFTVFVKPSIVLVSFLEVQLSNPRTRTCLGPTLQVHF